MDDDNLLADYDLSAWEVPPPAVGLVDTVVRNAREPMPHAIAKPRSLRPWIIGAGSLAALVAVLALLLWGVERAPKNGSGVVAASGPRSLDLGPSSAAIDAGAQLTWNRKGANITVSQSRGGATWHVGGDDKLAIDAAVASIEATGASLRVEVEMNRSDVRSVGIGSAAAIVVSLVTVIVYEGHVKATSEGQTVNIQPGATMQFGVKPPPPEQFNVGGSPEDTARIKELERQVATLKLKLELSEREKQDLVDGKKDSPPKDAKPSCDEVSCVLNNYSGTCCNKYKKTTSPPTCDDVAFAKKGDDYLANGMDTAALMQFERAIACKKDFAYTKKALLAACRSKQSAKANLHYLSIPEAQQSSYSQICLRFGIILGGKSTATTATTTTTCDADALKTKGEDYLSNGMDTAALAQLEASLRCKFDAGVVKTAFLAACRSKQQAKAKLYFSQLPAAMASNYSQICKRFGIDVEGDSKSVTKGTTGQLRIASSPMAAKIMVDGVVIGTTPVVKQLLPGKHKVTFIVDENKYTYSVTVKANEVTNLSKDFSAFSE